MKDLKDSFSAVVNLKLNNKGVNVVFDTGAGRSVIDVGSLEHLGLANTLKKPKTVLVNASGDTMEVIGVVDIIVNIRNMRPIKHEFTVINTKSYRNILIGRDFMKLFNKIFNFPKLFLFKEYFYKTFYQF